MTNIFVFLFSAIISIFLYSFLIFFLGYVLIRRFPRFGARLWALSGLFLKKLASTCPLDRCLSCSLWTCPNCKKK